MTREIKEVEITLNRETRRVVIERASSKHCWFARCTIMVRFPTGKKLHKRWMPSVGTWHDRSGERFEFGTQIFNNRHCSPVRFAQPEEEGSGWNKRSLSNK